MATMVLQYCVLVFLLGLTATYAGYCGKNCCQQKGIDKPSCDGSGTSDVSDLFGKIYGGKKTVCVAGKQSDAYRVWNAIVQWQQGIQTAVYFYGLYAFMFQIPKSASPNCVEYLYFIFEFGVCAKLVPITEECTGNVAGTNFPYKKLIQIADRNTKPSLWSAPCQVFQPTYGSCPSAADTAQNTRIDTDFSGVVAAQYLTSNGSCFMPNIDYPMSIAKSQRYSVTFDPKNGMFYQPGYRYGKQYKCIDSNPYSAAGYCFIGYNFAEVNVGSGVCGFSTYYAACESQYPLPQLYFEIVFFLLDPYDDATVFYSLTSANAEFPTFRPFFTAAC